MERMILITGMRRVNGAQVALLLKEGHHSYISVHRMRLMLGHQVDANHQFIDGDLSAQAYLELFKSASAMKKQYVLWCKEYDEPVVAETAKLAVEAGLIQPLDASVRAGGND